VRMGPLPIPIGPRFPLTDERTRFVVEMDGCVIVPGNIVILPLSMVASVTDIALGVAPCPWILVRMPIVPPGVLFLIVIVLADRTPPT
jgi:hypothetical protein